MHKINSWVITAITHNLQLLELDAGLSLHEESKSYLTEHVFACPSLRVLKLKYVIITLPTTIHLPMLTTLQLEEVEPSNEDFQMLHILLKFFSNIESLMLENYELFWSLQITKTKSRQWFEYKLPYLKMVQIRNFKGCKNGIKFVKFLLENATSLEQVSIMPSDKSLKDKIWRKIAEGLLPHSRASSNIGTIIFV